MKTILVDDELWALDQFRHECLQLEDIELIGEFTNSEDAYAFALENHVDFALLDIEMPGMSGTILARKLRALNPEVIIVFVTGHRKYLEDFINIKADYYVIKPYTKADVEDVLSRARLLSGRFKNRVSVRTFGDFDVFVDGSLLRFQSAKAKELFALLVQKRGAELTPQEAMDCIWDGRDYDKGNASVYRMTLSRLLRTLENAGIEDILRSGSRGKYIDTSKIDCDLYRFYDGDQQIIRGFSGEYMSKYAWAEPVLANLLKLSDQEEK